MRGALDNQRATPSPCTVSDSDILCDLHGFLQRNASAKLAATLTAAGLSPGLKRERSTSGVQLVIEPVESIRTHPESEKAVSHRDSQKAIEALGGGYR